MTESGVSQSPRLRKLFLLAKNEIGLTDDERIELSTYLLRRDMTTWKQLDDEQAGRLLDALEGYLLVTELLRQRQSSAASSALQ